VAHQPTYLSFFSGCLGLDLGFHQAGFRCLSLNELNPHAQATIEQNLSRFGDSPPRLYRDSMLDLTPERIMQDLGIVPGEVDVMIGGPPCQSFSVAGKRLGFADPRGQLFLRFLDLIAVIRPRFTLIENVRGILSKKFGAGRFDGISSSDSHGENIRVSDSTGVVEVYSDLVTVEAMKLALVFFAWLVGLVIGDLITWNSGSWDDVASCKMGPLATWAVITLCTLVTASVTYWFICPRSSAD
jgi:hypothetical protein